MILLNWLIGLRNCRTHTRKSVLPKPAVVRHHIGQRVECLEDRCVLSSVSAAYSVADASWFDVVTPSSTATGNSLSGTGVGSSSTTITPRQFLVRLTPEAVQQIHSPHQAEALFANSGAGLHVARGLGLPGQLLVTTSERDSARVVAALQNNPHVSHFEEDFSVGAASQIFPNEKDLAPSPGQPLFSDLYGLHNVGQNGGTDDADIDAPEAWSKTTGSSQVIVSVIDSGVDFTHPDLYQNIWLNQAELPAALRTRLVNTDGVAGISFRDLNHATNRALRLDPNNAASPLLLRDRNGTDYIDAGDLLDDPLWSDGIDTDKNGFEDDLVGWDFQDNDNRPFDEHGHGTHVAGILGATGDNNLGVVGVNWKTSILPLRFLDENNTGDLSDAIEAINYQTLLRTSKTNPANIRVSNNSWGVSGSLSQNLFDAVAATGEADILFVAAAGNGDVLGRGIDNDQVPFYPANLDLPNVISVGAFGADGSLARFSNFGDQSVDIAAPGVGIVSTAPGRTYISRNGTSMATPFVTGTAALVFSSRPNSAAIEVRDALLQGAETRLELANEIRGGRRLDAFGALTAPTFAPVPSLTSVAPITSAGGTSLNLVVTYTDDEGVHLDSIDSADLEITRTGFSATRLVPGSFITNGTGNSVTATYQLAALGGSWDATDFGEYVVRLRPGELTDANGVSNAARELGRFRVEITSANVFFVNTTTDSVDEGTADGMPADAQGRVSLRAAIRQANANAVPTTIVVPDGVYALRLAGRNEDAGRTGDLDITLTANLTILGGGATTTRIDGQQLDRVFDIGTGAHVTIRGLTILNGNATVGGGIQNKGTLSLDSVIVSQNTAEESGGGIFNSGGLLTVLHSSIEANRTTSRFFGQGGGGIASDRAGTTVATAVIDSSSIVNNVSSLAGGGIALLHSDLTLEDSTISGNIAQRENGGGLFVGGGRLVESETLLTIRSSTIMNNRADLGNGGGLAVNSPTLRLDTNNSIISQNFARFSDDIDGVILSHGNNLFGQPSETFAPWRQLVSGVADFDQIGTARSPRDPNLEPLQPIDGIVQSHSPQFGGVATNSDIAGLAGLALTPGMPIVYSTVELEPNNTPAEAMNLDDRGWSLAANPDISNATTIPHVTITGTGDGTFDYFAFNVSTAGSNAVFDIDNAGILPDGFFDTELFLFGLDGTLLASNNDSTTDAGSTSSLDSRMTYQFAAPGRYVIAVGAFNSTSDSPGLLTGAFPTLGKEYVLHVSLEHHPLAATIYDATTASASHPLDGVVTENGYLFSAEEGLNLFDMPRSYGTGNVPRSVAKGDVNGDGLLDLVTANSGSTTVSVLIGRSDSTFEEAVNYLVGNSPYSVAMGDVNGDGRLDVVTANYSSGTVNGTVSVLIGRGDGTLNTAVNYTVGSRPSSVAIGDVSGDGLLDLVTANSGSTTVSVLIGRVDGTFEAAVDKAIGVFPFSVAVGDVTGDGRLDLVTANYSSGTVSVLIGRVGGMFDAAVNYPVDSGPSSVAIGDVDGDRLPDLVTANYSSGTVSVLIGQVDHTFKAAVNSPVDSGPFSVAIGDVDGNRLPDLVTANYSSGTVSVLIGQLDHTFKAAVNYAAGSHLFSVVMGDVTGDDRLDLITANDHGFSGTVSLLIGQGDGTFDAAVNYASGSSPSSVAIGDVTGDGRLDLVTANKGSGNVSVRGGRGDGTFNAAVNYPVGSGTSPAPSFVAMGYVNSDDRLDLVTANSGSSNVSVLTGRSDGTFNAAVNYPIGASPSSVAMGYVNGDSLLDIVTANDNGIFSTGSVSVLIGRVDGTFNTAVNYAVDSGATSVAMGDLNGDGRLDIVTANQHSAMSVLIGQGDGTFLAAVKYPSNFDPESVAVGDVNDDGRLDVVLSNLASDTVSVLIGQGDGTFAAAVNYRVGFGTQHVIVGDVTGDGRLDLVTANEGGGNVGVLIGRGDGTFLAAENYSVGTGARFLALGDLNGDGRPDLATATNAGVTVGIHSRSRLFQLSPEGDELLSLPSRGTPQLIATGTAGTYWVTASSQPNAVDLWSYGDSDGIRQLTSLTFSSTRDFPIKLLVGDGAVLAVSAERLQTVNLATQSAVDVSLPDGTFEEQVNYQVGNFPFSVAMGDLTGDGRLDVVTANQSSGTVSVLIGRSDGTFNKAVQYPVAAFPRFVATGKLNADNWLDVVTVSFNGTVSVLIGQGDGTFQTAVNYSVGSGGAPEAVTVGDVTGDGLLDLVKANTSSTTVSVLSGRGDGTFNAAVNYTVGSNPASVAIGDVNGDFRPDFVTANAGSGNASVLIKRVDGTFEAPVTYDVGDRPQSVVLKDLTGEGRLDLVTADYFSDTVSVLIGKVDGTFNTAVTYRVGSHPEDVTVRDVNGDGRQDLVTPNAGSDDVSVLIGRGDGTFLTAVSYSVGIDPQSVAVGDVTGDGVLDLVTTNLASNNVSVLAGRSRVTATAQLNGTTFVANTAVIQKQGLNDTSFTPLQIADTISRGLKLRRSDYAYLDLGVFESQLLAAVRLNNETPRPGELELLLINPQTGVVESLLTNSSLRLTGIEDDLLQVVGNTIYLTATLLGGGVGTQLFAFDRVDGLRLVADLPVGLESSQVRDLFVDQGGDVYFTALARRVDNTTQTDTLRQELFVVDAETGELRAIRAGQDVTGTPELVGSTVYFSSRVSSDGPNHLWSLNTTTGDDGIPSIGAFTPATGAVNGVAFLDTNRNGRRDADEPGRVGVVIYADINGNGRRDTDDPFVITRADDPATTVDESGEFAFRSLAAGPHLLREQTADGFLPTSPQRLLDTAPTLAPVTLVIADGPGSRLGLPSVVGESVVYVDRATNTLWQKSGNNEPQALVFPDPEMGIPDAGAAIQSLGSAQAQDSSHIVFTATLTNGDELVVLRDANGDLKIMSSTGATLPTQTLGGTLTNVSLVDIEGELLQAFSPLSVEGDSVGFFATPSSASDGRYYLGDGSRFAPFDHAQVILSGGTELFVDRVLEGNPPTVLTGEDVFLDVAALAAKYPGRNSGWTITTRNGEEILPLTFLDHVTDVAASGLTVAFRASSSAVPDGIYVSSPEGTRLLTSTGTPISVRPTTSIAFGLTAFSSSASVFNASLLPENVPFDIRIGREFMSVTAMEGNRLTVIRGVRGTSAVAHAAGETVSLVLPAFGSVADNLSSPSVSIDGQNVAFIGLRSPLPNDASSSLLLHFDGNASGANGEVPTQNIDTSFVSGLFDQSLSTFFSDTQGFVTYPTDGNILPSQGTVEFWIRPNSNGNTFSNFNFFEVGDNFNNGMLMALDAANNLRFIQWGDDPTTTTVESGVERGIGASASHWVAGEWHHLAATWDGTARTLAFYVDGESVGTVRNGVQISNFSSTDLTIGAESFGATPAQAAFDEFRISNRVRTPEEIRADYRRESKLGLYASINGQLRTIVDQDTDFGGRIPVDFSISHQALSGNRIVFL